MHIKRCRLIYYVWFLWKKTKFGSKEKRLRYFMKIWGGNVQVFNGYPNKIFLHIFPFQKILHHFLFLRRRNTILVAARGSPPPPPFKDRSVTNGVFFTPSLKEDTKMWFFVVVEPLSSLGVPVVVPSIYQLFCASFKDEYAF